MMENGLKHISLLKDSVSDEIFLSDLPPIYKAINRNLYVQYYFRYSYN